ncbi:MAG TPA: cytochrome c3 family protein [Anaeromyxobacter sp.]|nr:cytochrome c3 family protein [Anaeromyxobacter sp.]
MNRLALPLALLLAAGCSAKALLPEAKSEEPVYNFPHQPHVDGDVPCTACHAAVAASSALEANVRHVRFPAKPSKDPACNGCHDSDPDVSFPVRTAPFRLRFDHTAHLRRVKDGDCKVCHKDLPEVGDASLKSPPMAVCTGCHNHQQSFAEARCNQCHLDLRGLKPVTAFAHVGDWLKLHGAAARPSAESCAACHDQTYCAECHAAQTVAALPVVIFPEQVDRDFIHRGNYVSRHMIDAQANPASCRTCHGSAFCSACHTEQGVSETAVNVRDPHPAGWATDKGTSHFHGDAARRDILACAGCHDNGASAVCVGCHQMGGVGGNPHPNAFLRRHEGEEPHYQKMCSACHTHTLG